jgi:hypothetical protein
VQAALDQEFVQLMQRFIDAGIVGFGKQADVGKGVHNHCLYD